LDVSQILHSSKSIDPGGVSEEGDHPFSKLVNIYTPPIFFIPKAILFFNKVLKGAVDGFLASVNLEGKRFSRQRRIESLIFFFPEAGVKKVLCNVWGGGVTG